MHFWSLVYLVDVNSTTGLTEAYQKSDAKPILETSSSSQGAVPVYLSMCNVIER